MDYNKAHLEQITKIKEEIDSANSATTPNSKSILHEAFLLSFQGADGTLVNPSTLLAPGNLVQTMPAINTNTINMTSTQPEQLQQPHKKQRHIYESPEARARRLARNAQRMRERRANETEMEYRTRLAKMAEAGRLKRRNESEIEKTMRHLKSAARQRMARALESTEHRTVRLAKLAQRSRMARQNETPEQKADRRRKCLEHNRSRIARKKKQQSGFNNFQQPEQPLTPEQQLQQQLLHQQQLKTNSDNLTQSILETSLNKFTMPSAASVCKVENVQNINVPINGVNQSVNQPYSTTDAFYPQYHTLKTNPFPELPPHVVVATSNDQKFYGTIQNFSAAPMQYITTTHPSPQQPNQLSSVSSSSAPTLLTIGNRSIISTTPTYQVAPSQVMYPIIASPESPRGRPVKILPSNNYQTIAPTLQGEALRQQRMNTMLEEQINIMLATPGRGRQEKLKKLIEAGHLQIDKVGTTATTANADGEYASRNNDQQRRDLILHPNSSQQSVQNSTSNNNQS